MTKCIMGLDMRKPVFGVNRGFVTMVNVHKIQTLFFFCSPKMLVIISGLRFEKNPCQADLCFCYLNTTKIKGGWGGVGHDVLWN